MALNFFFSNYFYNTYLYQTFHNLMLTSFLTRNFSSSYKQKTFPELSDYQKEAIDGLMLSDGHAQKKRLKFTFKAGQLTFTKWLKFEVLGNLSTENPPTPYPPAPKVATQYWFGTKVHPYFENREKNWYNMGRKVLPKDIKITPVTLAFLIMGDGYWENDSKTIFICSENFTLEEVKHLIDLLRRDLKRMATTKKRGNNYRIRFSSRGKNLVLVRELVAPFMHPDMMYKLGI